MQPRLMEQIPRFGWTKESLAELDLSDTDLPFTSEAIERPPGLYRASVSIYAFPGTITGVFSLMQVFLEGSNTGGTDPAEWNQIATLPENNPLLGPNLFTPIHLLMGSRISPIPTALDIPMSGDGLLPIGRYAFLRIRVVVTLGTPIFTDGLIIRLTGIAGDAEKFTRTTTLTKLGGVVIPGNDIVATGDPVRRPAGTRFMTAQSLVTSLRIDPDPSQGYSIFLQGALNQGAVDNEEWITIDRVPDAPVDESFRFDVPPGPAQAYFFNQGQTATIDMGPFEFLRVIMLRISWVGITSSDLSSITVDTVMTFDDVDWLSGDVGLTNLAESLIETFISNAWYDIVEAAGVFTVRLQLLDMNQNPINAQRVVGIVVTDAQWASFGAASTTATFDTIASVAPATGAAVLAAALPTATSVIRTDSSGQAEFTLSSTASPDTVFISIFNVIPDIVDASGGQEFSPGQLVIATQRTQLDFP